MNYIDNTNTGNIIIKEDHNNGNVIKIKIMEMQKLKQMIIMIMV